MLIYNANLFLCNKVIIKTTKIWERNVRFGYADLPPTQNHEDSWSESQQIISVSQSQAEWD